MLGIQCCTKGTAVIVFFFPISIIVSSSLLLSLISLSTVTFTVYFMSGGSLIVINLILNEVHCQKILHDIVSNMNIYIKVWYKNCHEDGSGLLWVLQCQCMMGVLVKVRPVTMCLIVLYIGIICKDICWPSPDVAAPSKCLPKAAHFEVKVEVWKACFYSKSDCLLYFCAILSFTSKLTETSLQTGFFPFIINHENWETFLPNLNKTILYLWIFCVI